MAQAERWVEKRQAANRCAGRPGDDKNPDRKPPGAERAGPKALGDGPKALGGCPTPSHSENREDFRDLNHRPCGNGMA